VTDLADSTHTKSAALGLDEIQASVWQYSPARIPALDPMVLDGNGNANLWKLNAYRLSVDQYAAHTLNDASTRNYCNSLLRAAPRIFSDQVYTARAPSPAADAANLFLFLINRYIGTYAILTCQNLTRIPVPFKLSTQPASVTRLQGYTQKQIDHAVKRLGRVFDITVDATLSPDIDSSLTTLTDDPVPAEFAVGESVAVPTTTAAAASDAYLAPLIAVSTVLGVVVVAGGTVMVVKKVQERRQKKFAAERPNDLATAEFQSTDLQSVNVRQSADRQPVNVRKSNMQPDKAQTTGPAYVADISGGFPVPITPKQPSAPPKQYR